MIINSLQEARGKIAPGFTAELYFKEEPGLESLAEDANHYIDVAYSLINPQGGWFPKGLSVTPLKAPHRLTLSCDLTRIVMSRRLNFSRGMLDFATEDEIATLPDEYQAVLREIQADNHMRRIYDPSTRHPPSDVNDRLSLATVQVLEATVDAIGSFPSKLVKVFDYIGKPTSRKTIYENDTGKDFCTRIKEELQQRGLPINTFVGLID